MKKRTIYIGLFLIFIIGVVSLIGTLATDTTITEGNSSKADYLFNITLGDRTNREIVIPSYDSKIVDIKISNPNEFNMSYLLYLEGINSYISIINISDTEASGVLNSKNTNLIKVFIQNNSSTDITVSIKDLVGFEKEILELPSNSTGINKGAYYKAIVKSNNNTYGKVKPNIKLSTKNGTVKYNIVPNDGYQYKSTTCEGTVVDNILTVSNITSNISCEVVFEPKNITISLDLAGGKAETTYTEAKEHTYSVLYNGTYQLEVWGAQGGTTTDGTPGGYGGYSQGTVTLNANSNLYINIGGQGSRTEESVAQEIAGGYNGGGLTGGQSCCGRSFGSGGGATHIAIKSGLLSSLENYKDTILIVAGGGGGSYYGGYGLQGGSGGGYLGADGKEAEAEDSQYCAGLGGSQTIGGSVSTDCYHKNDIVGGITGLFGQGGGSTGATTGGGGGFYGGSRSGHVAPGGGGSGYIGNSSLTDKYMYCYNCATSDGESTKTYSTTNVSEIAISNYAKSGDGAAKITLISNANYNVTYKDKYGTLPTPTRTGYTFEGWYTGENGTGTKITSDTVLTNENNHTLYAKWTKKNIIVSYNLSYDVSNVQNWLYANGFESRFTNSYDSSTGTSTISCAGSGGWEIIYFEMDTIANTEYEVTFEYEIPSSYKTLSGYSGIGYQALTAIGDSDNSSNSLAVKYLPTSATTSAQKTTLSFKATTTKTYFALNFGMAADGVTTTIKIKNVNVKYKNTITTSYGDKYGTMPTPTRVGYTFEGWYTGENGTGTKVDENTTLTNENNHTLYAKWTKKNIIVSYNLSYDVSNVQNWLYANGFESRFTNSYDSSTGTSTISCAGSGGWEIIYFEMDTIANTEYEVTFEYEIPSSYKTLSGYSGIGYQALTAIGDSDNSSNSLAVKYLPTSATTSAQKTTLSFKATTTKTYFALNFGMAADGVTTTIKIKNVNVKYKNTITTSYGDKYGTMPTPTRVGYTFEGWYTGENGTGTKVDENTTLTNENNHTLYAKWTPNTYYLDLNGFLDGAGSGVIAGYGTADVYIDGVLVCDDCTDYYVEHPYGTHYSISDIKNSAGHTYNGVYSGSVNGTIKGPTSLLLSFSTNTYTITTNYYRYQDSSWIHFDSRTDTALYGSSFSPYNIAAPAGYYASNSFSYFDSASNPLGTGTVGVDSIAVIGNMTVNVHYYSSDTTKPTCTLSANASTITATASDDKGIAYQGWSSSYSGSNSASKSISAGTHTYYVKDTSGNTNTCSLSIVSTINESYTYSDTCTKNVKLKSCSTKCTCSSGWYTSSGWAGPGCYETQYYTCTKEGTRIACSSGYTKINDNWCYK